MNHWWPAQILITPTDLLELICITAKRAATQGTFHEKCNNALASIALWTYNLYTNAMRHKSQPCFNQNPQQHNVTNAVVVDHVDLPRAPSVLNPLANTLRIIKDQLSWWWSSCWCELNISRLLLYQAPPTSPGQPGNSITILQFFNFPHLWSCVDVDWGLSKTIECDWVGPSFHSVPPGRTLYCVWKGLQIIRWILRQDQIKGNEIGKDSIQAPPLSETRKKTKTNMKPEFSLQQMPR